MKKIISSSLTKAISILLGFVASFNFMRSISMYFNLHAWRALGFTHVSLTNRQLSSFLWFSLFIIALIFFMLAIWHSPKTAKIWQKIDSTLLVLLTICVAIFCTRWLFSSPFSVYIIVFAPLLIYLFTLFTVTQLIVHIRNKSIVKTLYWWHFFNQPNIMPKVAIGIILFITLALVTIELIGVIGLITGIFSLRRLSLFWDDWRFGINLTPFTLFMLSMIASQCALNYLAAYLLGLSAKYETANVEKLRSERFKTELITNVSHDIRTPLTSIINYTDLLKKQQLQGNAAEYVNILDKKATRLKQLLNDLIDASYASSGNLKVDIQPLNLTEMLGQVAGEFSNIFDNQQLPLVLRQPDDPLYVQADSRHLYRALENLFSNAAKYSLEGTRVFAEIYPAQAALDKSSDNTFYSLSNRRGKKITAYFVIRNTSKIPIDGPVNNLTEQFIRGDLARNSEGSGLGLYIAKSLIELMGGRLKISVSGDLFEVIVGV